MQGFSSSFLIFFFEIALGGMLALASTPFHEIERAFYKSTAGVLYVIAVFGWCGKVMFYWHGMAQEFAWTVLLEAIFHTSFVVSFTCYLSSLWVEWPIFRARSFASTILSGIAALFLATQSFYAAPVASIETLTYFLSFFLSSMLLGSVTVGMLMGHWYLIDTGQSLAPFIRLYKFFVVTLVAQCGIFAIAPIVLYHLGSHKSALNLARLWEHHSTLAITRVAVGQFAPLVLSWMIWRTLLIPHTMAATGLFYIALLGVFVGEILGRQILALTSLPF